VLGNSTTKIHIGKGVSLFPFQILLPPSKNIIQESRWYLSTTTHCARVAGGLGERCSRCVFCYRCRHKHTCGVAVATASIYLRGCGFESPWGHVYFFNLILARRQLYGGMGMCFAGRRNENDRYRMVEEHRNRLCARRRELKRQNKEWELQNREWWQNT
jgi:hypothetical protein